MLSPDSGINGRRGMAVPGTILLVLAALLLLAGERLSFLESAYYDFLQHQQTRPGSDRILLIDTKSVTDAENLWDINLLSPLIDALNTAGAALIVPVEAPPANTPLPNIEKLTALAELEKRARGADDNDLANASMVSLDSQLAKLRKQFEHQAVLASAIKAAGNIVLPIANNHSKWSRDSTTDVCQQHTIPSSADVTPDVTSSLKETSGVLTLPDLLCEGARQAGYGGYWPDSDGIVRRTHLLVKSGTRIFPSLSLAAAQANRGPGEPAHGDLHVSGDYQIEVADQRIRTGPEFTSLLRFYEPTNGEQAFSTVSAMDLLNGDIPSEMFHDRIVVVGDLQADKSAGYRTPNNENMPAAMLLATSLSNLLQMDFVMRPHWLGMAELAILVLLGVAIFLSAPAMNNNRAATGIGILVIVLLATEAYLLIEHGIWVQLVTATLFTVLGIGLVQAMGKFSFKFGAAVAPVPVRVRASALESEDQLDLAFSVLRQQPPTDETKKRLYAIAITHGKLKEYAKAERVLVYLAAIDPHYRDVEEKLKTLSGARKKTREQKADKSDKTSRGEAQESSTDTRKKLGRYRLDSVLGRGAMATVYLGMDPSINRKVAIKTIALAEEFSDADLEAAKMQFRREAESAGRLNHPNIIAIYDTGEDGNVAYLAMEYFEGKALNHCAQSSNLLPPKWVLELGARVADALHYAHGQGVVHRDIKPANLLYDTATDTLKITDFGIARLTDTSRTKTGIILGTPSYMSPEQLAASAVTGKSDLYSLGITIYQLLTGTTPFRSDSIPKLMDKIMNEKHKAICGIRDDVPLSVDVMLDKALAKNPDDRYPNGRAMALALRDCCNNFDAA